MNTSRANKQLNYLQPQTQEAFISQQLELLLTTCACSLVYGKDYELEVAARAVEALTDQHETADVYLYAAIERKDWQEVQRIYQRVFRPCLLKAASRALTKALS